MKRKPTHPGIIIKKDYLEPLSITIKDMSTILGVSRKHYLRLLMKKHLSPQKWHFDYLVHLILHQSCG
jgi:Plasmid maintenance system antidote protein